MNLELNQIFRQYLEDLSTILPNAITAFIIFIIFVILGKVFYNILGKRIQKRWKDSLVSGFISAATKWAFYILGTIIALNIIGFGGIAGGIIAGAGVGAIIFGFAFKDIGENFLAGILLALNRPFEIGDIIEVNELKGTVRGIDLRTTHIRNVEGKDIYFPNSIIIKNTLINYTRDGNLRINFMIGIAPECDIQLTRNLILRHLEKVPQVLKTPKPNVLVQELGEYTTNLQVLFWVDIVKNRELPDSYLGHTLRSKIIADVKEILDKNNIEMPSQVLEHKMYREHRLMVEQQGVR